MNCCHIGLSRLKVLRWRSMTDGSVFPLGRRSRAGSPGRIRKSAKLNDATRMMVRTAFRIFRMKYRRLSTALRVAARPAPDAGRPLPPSHIRGCRTPDTWWADTENDPGPVSYTHLRAHE